jgi:hypothetical protein
VTNIVEFSNLVLNELEDRKSVIVVLEFLDGFLFERPYIPRPAWSEETI